MAAHITLSYSTTSNGATSATVKVTMKYTGNGVSYSNVARTCKITLNGTTKSFTHTFSTSTSAQTMGSASFTISKTHSARTLTASGSLDATNTSLGKLTDTVSVSVSAQTSYSVGYNANGGSGAPSAQTKWYGETLTLSSTKPTRTGYTFSKWNTASGGTGTNYASGGSYTANAAATLYAQWTTNTCVLTYNPNGGTVSPSTATKTYGATYGTLPTPTRTGYTFAGWYTAASGGSAVSSSTTITANTTIYAHWTELTATLTYNANGHGTAPSAVTMRYSTATTAASISATGYIFGGWNTKADGTGTTYQVGSTVKAANVVPTALTLYAQWTQAYKAPTISNIILDRGKWDGTAFSSNLSGEFMALSFNWTAGQDVNGIKDTSFSVTVKNAGEIAQSIDLPYTTKTATESGAISCVPITVNSEPITASVGQSPEITITVTDTTSQPTVSTVRTTNLTKGGYVVHISPTENAVSFFGFDDGSGDGVIINKPLKVQGNASDHMVTITGSESNASVMYNASRDDTNVSVKFGVGNGGTNHGVWSTNLAKWIAYSDGTYTWLNGTNANNSTRINADGDISTVGGVYLPNGKVLAMKDSGGTYRNAVTYNSSNQFTFGNGSYTTSTGGSYFDGNSVNIRYKSHLYFYDGANSANRAFQNMFNVSTASYTQASTASGANNGGTVTVSNAGWLPLGVIGWSASGGTNPSNANVYRCYLSARSSGSATVTIRSSNAGTSAMAPVFTIYILWVKET